VTATFDLHPLTAGSPPTSDAAVFVHEGPIGAHVGLVYRTATSGLHRLLHQAWHYDTHDDTIADWSVVARASLWWVIPGLDPYELADLRMAAMRTANGLMERQIPYAMDRKDAAIDSEGVVDLRASLGLTCATFVLLLFESANLQLIDAASWARDRSAARQAEDAAVHRRMVEYLRKEDPLHADRVQGDVECVRVRAEEVAVSSGITARPVGFSTADPLGRDLISRIRAR